MPDLIRYSTLDLLIDRYGRPFLDPPNGPCRHGMNPLWVKASDVEALEARIAALTHLLEVTQESARKVESETVALVLRLQGAMTAAEFCPGPSLP